MDQKNFFKNSKKNILSNKTLEIIKHWNLLKNEYLPVHRLPNQKTKRISDVLKKVELNISNHGMSIENIKNAITKYSEMFGDEFCMFSKNPKFYAFGLNEFLLFSKDKKNRINKNKSIKKIFEKVESTCEQIHKDSSFFYFNPEVQKSIEEKEEPKEETIEYIKKILEDYNKKFPNFINMDFNDHDHETILKCASTIQGFLKKYYGKLALQEGVVPTPTKDYCPFEKQKRFSNHLGAFSRWLLRFIIHKYPNNFIWQHLNAGFFYDDFLEYLDKKENGGRVKKGTLINNTKGCDLNKKLEIQKSQIYEAWIDNGLTFNN